MPLFLEEDEVVTVPPEGKRVVFVNAVGDTVQLTSDGAETPLGGGSAVADGVSIDGVGTEGDPLGAIPAYFRDLLGFTRIDVDANGQDQDITVDGETAPAIEVWGYVPNNNGSSALLTLQPNAVSTNQSYQESGAANTTANGAAGANLTVGFAQASGSTFFRMTFFAKTGTPRFYFGQYLYRNSSNAIVGISNTCGVWQEAVTAITSLRFHSSQTDGIKAGSVFWWRYVNSVDAA